MTAQPAHIARAPVVVAVPDEHREQCWLIQWCRSQARVHPALAMIYAIPNGGKRHPVVANKLRAEGVRSGVPDLCLPVARGTWHGLYIEMKRRRGGTVSEDQHGWLVALRKEGYRTEVCKGWEVARDVLMDYLRGTPSHLPENPGRATGYRT